MRNAPLLLTSALVIAGLGACHPVRTHAVHFGHGHGPFHDDRPVVVGRALECPETSGDLKRVSAAPDGASCRYADDDGRQIDLKLLALNGKSPQEALAPIEAEIAALVPLKGATGLASVDARSGGDEPDKAQIDLPGIHIKANGDNAHVRIFGADIKAEGSNAEVRTNLGVNNTQIHAGPGGAEIRAGEVGKQATTLLYVRAGEAAGPDGVHAAGYEARGPVGGPLVVGEFRSKDKSQREGGDDLQKLLTLNVRPSGDGG